MLGVELLLVFLRYLFAFAFFLGLRFSEWDQKEDLTIWILKLFEPPGPRAGDLFFAADPFRRKKGDPKMARVVPAAEGAEAGDLAEVLAFEGLRSRPMVVVKQALCSYSCRYLYVFIYMYLYVIWFLCRRFLEAQCWMMLISFSTYQFETNPES